MHATRKLSFWATLAVCSGGVACHDMTPQGQRARDVFECRVTALEPYIGSVFDVANVVRDTIQGKVDPVAIMSTLGATIADIHAAAEAWNACNPKPIVAPPPLPGDKVGFYIPEP